MQFWKNCVTDLGCVKFSLRLLEPEECKLRSGNPFSVHKPSLLGSVSRQSSKICLGQTFPTMAPSVIQCTPTRFSHRQKTCICFQVPVQKFLPMYCVLRKNSSQKHFKSHILEQQLCTKWDNKLPCGLRYGMEKMAQIGNNQTPILFVTV